MHYECVTGGMLAENCYLLIDDTTKEAIIIDPGFVNDALLRAITGLQVKLILLTHGHFDHIGGVDELRAQTGAPVAAFKTEGTFAADAALNGSQLMLRSPVVCTVDRLLEDGEVIPFGETSITVLHTPGHTAGGCCYCTPEAVFTGDTLMEYAVGRWDLPTGNQEQLMQSVQKLKAIPGDPDICGGHGAVTKLSDEKRRNPYL